MWKLALQECENDQTRAKSYSTLNSIRPGRSSISLWSDPLMRTNHLASNDMIKIMIISQVCLVVVQSTIQKHRPQMSWCGNYSKNLYHSTPPLPWHDRVWMFPSSMAVWKKITEEINSDKLKLQKLQVFSSQGQNILLLSNERVFNENLSCYNEMNLFALHLS